MERRLERGLYSATDPRLGVAQYFLGMGWNMGNLTQPTGLMIQKHTKVGKQTRANGTSNNGTAPRQNPSRCYNVNFLS